MVADLLAACTTSYSCATAYTSAETAFYAKNAVYTAIGMCLPSGFPSAQRRTADAYLYFFLSLFRTLCCGSLYLPFRRLYLPSRWKAISPAVFAQ